MTERRPSQPNPQSPSHRSQPPRSQPKTDKGTMWSLGAFMGEIWRAVKQPTETRSGGVTRLETSRHTDEHSARAPDGTPVTLRRTVIEEIEYPADRSPPKDDRPARDDPKP